MSAAGGSVYDDFAPFYDRYWGDFFLRDAQEGIAEHFLPLVPQGGRVLDLCCGTGQTARWLTSLGFRVIGLDGSRPMLESARRNAPNAGFVAADARSFEFSPSFDAALCLFDSINHLASPDDVAAAFANIRRALVPGGRLLFDVNLDEGFRQAADESFSVVKKEHVCVVKSEYDRRRGVAKSFVTLFTRNPGGWRRVDLTIPEYLHPRPTLEAALEAAGFRDVTIFDASSDFGMPRAEGRIFISARA